MTVNVPDNLCGLLVDTASVRPDPANYNRHSEAQVAQIAASIVAFGFDQPILARRNGLIIAGHGRWQAAKQLGMTQVPVVYTDLDGIDATRRMIGDNRLAALAEPHAETLAELLRQLQAEDALGGTGYDDVAVDALLKEVGGATPADDPGPQVDRAAELQAKWGTALRQVWALGEHRLVCGDCTDPAVVASVMRGETVALVVTDPPYGVEYADKNKFLNTIARGNRIQEPIANDHGSKTDIRAVWKAAFGEMNKVMRPGAVIYCFMPQGGDQMMMMMMMMSVGIEPRHELIWLKNNHVLGRVDYAYKHEPILYAWKDGGHKFYGDFQTSILEYDRSAKSDLHPTTKPVDLIAKLISNSSLPGEIVLDTFVGSGTTLIACERLGRKCRAVELSPAYVAVTLQRWADMTGQTPRLLES